MTPEIRKSVCMSKKVIIISKAFPPTNSMEAKRLGYMGRYMQQYGYIPYVLTEKIDTKIHVSGPCGKIGFLDTDMIEEKRIMRVDTPLKENCICNFFVSQFVRITKSMRLSFRSIDESGFCWYESCKKAYQNGELAIFKDADLIICTFPGVGAVYTARYFSKKMKIPYIVDIRDLMSQYADTDEGWKKSKYLDLLMEKWLLTPAIALTTTTRGFRDTLHKLYHKPCATIYNGWNTDYRDESMNRQSGEKYLYYAGCLYEHRMTSLFLLLNAMKKVNQNGLKVKLILRISGPALLYRKTSQYIKNNKLQEVVILEPSADESIVHEEQKRAFINIVFSETDATKKYLMTTIPGKVYELLTFAAPILTIAAPQTEIADILRVTNKGIVTLKEEEIISFIQGMNAQYTGNHKISFFSRKRQAQRMCRFFDGLMERTGNQ